jgi:hypothetical protein
MEAGREEGGEAGENVRVHGGTQVVGMCVEDWPDGGPGMTVQRNAMVSLTV